MSDYRCIGIIICQLLLREVFDLNENEIFHKSSFTYENVVNLIAIEKQPLPLCDLLRNCFAINPYDLGGELMTVDDESSLGSQSLSNSSLQQQKRQTKILNKDYKFMKDISLPLQTKISEGLCVLLKRVWSDLSNGRKWGEFIDVKDLMSLKETVQDWTPEMEELRIKEAQMM